MTAVRVVFIESLRRWQLSLAVLLCSVLWAAPAWADPPGRVGRLADLEGIVWLYTPDTGDWVQASRNQPLTSDDRLATDDGAHAELQIGSATLRLDGDSELEIVALDDSDVHLRLERGSIAWRERSADAADRIELETADGRFRSQLPGFYRVDRHDDASAATTWEGSLRFEDTNGETLAIAPGQRADVWQDGGLRSSFGTPEQDTFAAWAQARDQASARIAAPQPYVSPEMTGAGDLSRYGSWQQSADYGSLWIPAVVAADWAPYRFGRWAWVRPWGWTWIDDAPWGFAPFHYGRWVSYQGRWGWAPGRYTPRPVYAPALVAWVGGGGGHRPGHGPSVGWFPLGPRELYVPGYKVSPRYVRHINGTHVDRIGNIGGIVNDPNDAVNRGRYVNRDGGGVTFVPSSVLTRREPVGPVARRRMELPGQGGAGPDRLISAAPVTAPPMPANIGRIGPPPIRSGFGPRERSEGPQERQRRGGDDGVTGLPRQANIVPPPVVMPRVPGSMPSQQPSRPLRQDGFGGPDQPERSVEPTPTNQHLMEQLQRRREGRDNPQRAPMPGVAVQQPQPAAQRPQIGVQPMVPSREPLQPVQPVVPSREPMRPVQPMVPSREPLRPVQPMQPQPAPQIQPREQRSPVERRFQRSDESLGARVPQAQAQQPRPQFQPQAQQPRPQFQPQAQPQPPAAPRFNPQAVPQPQRQPMPQPAPPVMNLPAARPAMAPPAVPAPRAPAIAQPQSPQPGQQPQQGRMGGPRERESR